MATTPLTHDSILTRLKISNKLLGTGSFAVVHRGTWDGRPCAVKVLRPQHANRPRDPKRTDCPAQMLKREGNLLMRYPHRSLVGCYAVLELRPSFPGLSTGYKCSVPALILEYLQNGSLYKLLLQQHATPWNHLYDDRTAMSWSIQISSALVHLHGLSPAVIHRDVKMENVILNTQEAQDSNVGGDTSVSSLSGAAGTRRPLLVKLVDLGLHVAAFHSPDEQLFRAAASSSFCYVPSGTGSTQSPFLRSSTIEAVNTSFPSADPPAFTRITYSGGGGSTIFATGGKNLRRCGTSGLISSDNKAVATAGAATITSNGYSSIRANSSGAPLFLALVAGSSRMQRVDPRSPGLRNRNATLIPPEQRLAAEAAEDNRAVGSAGDVDGSAVANMEFICGVQRELSSVASGSSTSWMPAAGGPHGRCTTPPLRAFQCRDQACRPSSGCQRQVLPPSGSPQVTARASLRLALQLHETDKGTMNKQVVAPSSTSAGSTDEVLVVNVAPMVSRTEAVMASPSAQGGEEYRGSSNTSAAGGVGAAEDACGRGRGAETLLLPAKEWPSITATAPSPPRGDAPWSSIDGAIVPSPPSAMRTYESSVPMESVYRLTGATGSLMTMAPEVYQGLPYNEKADVFSFGVILYELFSRSLLLVTHINTRKPGVSHVFVHRVCMCVCVCMAAVGKGFVLTRLASS
ncbi:hypothetical protein Vretifemale_4812 [Volvox reticuliferus]|uniref:Protein kinase domain-containing protein n=1 Tax=Volvox reticuliferus TaxID=1737510 RepID=A0A8J4C5A4_9CHLO|nr:hypothetical protein Vretifemale_4812 [Volvox reticuliferus]